MRGEEIEIAVFGALHQETRSGSLGRISESVEDFCKLAGNFKLAANLQVGTGHMVYTFVGIIHLKEVCYAMEGDQCHG
jgi:hypothetical protein